jgi:hypothetical protein
VVGNVAGSIVVILALVILSVTNPRRQRVEVEVGRILKVNNPLITPPWPGLSKITEEEVSVAIQQGAPDVFKFPRNSRRVSHTRAYHVGRVAHFVVYGWSDAIQIDLGVPSLACQPKWIVVDGNHRLAAAYLRGDTLIEVDVSGEVKYAKDLLGIDI